MNVNLYMRQNQVVENGDTGDDRAITAMGLLNTMETILNVMESKESVQMALEPIVLRSGKRWKLIENNQSWTSSLA